MNVDNFDDICKFDVTTYGELKNITDTLSKCRVRIFYKGMNRNRTYISDDFANQLIASLPYAPIKGIFNKNDLDYEDHGEKNTDGRIYGIVPENPNFLWEKHLDEDGVEREYACADVYLFTGLYPEASLIPSKPQSMEIFRKTMTGEWKIWDDGKPYFHFYHGGLVGLQTLGDEIEPCFEGAAFYNLIGISSQLKEIQECLNYIKNTNKKEASSIMDMTIFRLSDSEKAMQIEAALNPNFNEEGGWQYDYCVIDTYDTYALCGDKKRKQYVRVGYTKDDISNNVTIGDMEDVQIVDVTQTEYAALMALQAVGSYSEIETSYKDMKEEIVALKNRCVEYTQSLESAVKKNIEYEAKIKEFEANSDESTDTEKIEEYSKKIGELETKVAEFEAKIAEFEAEKVRIEEEKNDLINKNTELSDFKKNIETEKKTAIIDEFAEHFTDEQIQGFKNTMDNFSVADFKKEVCTAAYDSDPTIFSKKESGLMMKGTQPDVDGGNKVESGALRLLNKFKNGGSK